VALLSSSALAGAHPIDAEVGSFRWLIVDYRRQISSLAAITSDERVDEVKCASGQAVVQGVRTSDNFGLNCYGSIP